MNERTARILEIVFVIAGIYLGFGMGVLIGSSVVKAEQAKAPAVSEWVAFYEAHPEFEATDSNCARLEKKAVQIEESLEDAYAEPRREVN